MSEPRVARVAFTHLERVLWPEVGFTKRDMIAYYDAVADVLVPHLRGRPLTLGRFPEGVHAKGWYQTKCRGAPSWLTVTEVPATRGDEVFRMCVVDDRDSLLWVANQGTVELHPYLSAAGALDEPVTLVIDLDPGPGAGLVECCRVALSIRDALAADALNAAVKTSGSSGLHLFVGLAAGATFGQTRRYAQVLAQRLVVASPSKVVDSFRMADRAGKVLLDWRQNERSRSMIAPYSLRATPWPLVSMPVSWDEIETVATSGDARSLFFVPRDALDRVARTGDLFATALDRTASLPSPGAPGAEQPRTTR